MLGVLLKLCISVSKLFFISAKLVLKASLNSLFQEPFRTRLCKIMSEWFAPISTPGKRWAVYFVDLFGSIDS